MIETDQAKRWGVSARTIANWRKVGERVGVAPPVEAEDPEEMLEWYRTHVGREPTKKVLAAAERMRPAGGEGPVEEIDVEIDARPVEVLADVLGRLGLRQTLARVVEEEDRAWAVYEETRARGENLDAALRRWKSAQEVKRQLQKSEDAVAVAMELLKEWVRKEWEPRERALRSALAGKELGRAARRELMATTTPAEWERVWDREMERVMEGREVE